MSSRKQYFKNIANISIAWWVWPRTIIMYVTELWLSFVNWISGANWLKDELTRDWTIYGPWPSVTSDKWFWITKVETARRIALCLWMALCITPYVKMLELMLAAWIYWLLCKALQSQWTQCSGFLDFIHEAVNDLNDPLSHSEKWWQTNEAIENLKLLLPPKGER